MPEGGQPTFDLAQLALLHRCLQRAEELVSAAFHIPALPSKHYPYEVATLGELWPGERASEVFAQLMVYERARASGVEPLYRICLQDDALLRRLADGGSGWLAALLVYVLTHELVHVVRFQRAEESFAVAGTGGSGRRTACTARRSISWPRRGSWSGRGSRRCTATR